MAVEYHCCSAPFFEHIVIIVVLVLFAGLMSLSLVDLEVLAKSGTEQDRKHAGTYRLPARVRSLARRWVAGRRGA